MRTIAVLRPAERAGPTLARIAAAGGRGVAVPLFRLVAVPWRAPGGCFDAVVLTSANAVRLAGPIPPALAALPAWAVGAATASAARAAGFALADGGGGDAAALADAMRAAGVGRALWLAGRDRAIHPPAEWIAVATYAAEPIAGVDPHRIAGTVALVHSARAGARLAELLPRDGVRGARAGTALCAISPRAAAGAGAGWESVTIACRADDASLVAAAIDRARGGSDKRR